jgi:CDP-glycerol glycerophosphotransferase (TagB/SpsB family)
VFFKLFIKQSPNLVILTSFHGDGYRGNTKVIFEALQNHPLFEAVWLSRDMGLVRELQSRFGKEKACLMHSLTGINQLGKARFILMTHGTSDYAFMKLPGRATLIQTYHGLPTKRGEYLRPHGEQPPGWFHRKILRYRFYPIDYFLSSSAEVTNLFSARFNMNQEQFVETGYPYTDEIIRASKIFELLDTIIESAQTRAIAQDSPSREIPQAKHNVENQALQSSKAVTAHTTSKQSDPLQSPSSTPIQITNGANISSEHTNRPKHIILYAPTYRKLKRTRWFPFEDFDTEKLHNFLTNHNALLILRPHPNENPELKYTITANRRIAVCTHKKLEDTAGLLALCNVIVTDYSGIYLEGLLRDTPAVFLPYDLDSYERGFPWEYDEVTPGPKPKTFCDFLKSLESAFSGAPDFATLRNQVKDRFFSETDGNSTNRVIAFLEKQMQT